MDKRYDTRYDSTHPYMSTGKTVPGAVIRQADAHILPGRIGHADRKQAVQHIQQMQETGHLTADEAVIRQNQAAEAQTRAELQELTRDLPGPADTRGFRERWDWKEPRYYLPVLIGGTFVSVLSPTIVGGILSDMGIFNKANGELVFWPFFVAGIIGFFLCVISMVVKLVGTNEQQRRS